MKLTNRLIIPIVTILSVSLWCIAAFLPAYFSSGRTPDIYGLMCFVYGPLALVFIASSGVGWLGNVFGVIAIWFLWKRNYKNALRYAVVAVIIGCFALFVTEVPANENGDTDSVTLGPGIFLWLGSLAVIGLGTLVAMRNKNTPEPELRFTKWQKKLDPKTRVRLMSIFIGLIAVLLAIIFIVINEIV